MLRIIVRKNRIPDAHNTVKDNVSRMIRIMQRKKEMGGLNVGANHPKLSERVRAASPNNHKTEEIRSEESTATAPTDNSVVADTIVGEVTTDELEILETSQLPISKELKPLDLNGAVQIIKPIAASKFPGKKGLTRMIVSDLRRQASRMGTQDWELIAAVHLKDTYNMDMFHISGGKDEFSHYENLMDSVIKARSNLFYSSDRSLLAPSSIVEDLGNLGGKDTISKNTKEELTNRYKAALNYAKALQTANEKYQEAKKIISQAMLAVTTVTTFGRELAIIPESLSYDQPDIYKERVSLYLEQLQTANRELTRRSLAIASDQDMINDLREVISDLRVQLSNVWEENTKLRNGYAQSLENHRALVKARQDYYIRRESHSYWLNQNSISAKANNMRLAMKKSFALTKYNVKVIASKANEAIVKFIASTEKRTDEFNDVVQNTVSGVISQAHNYLTQQRVIPVKKIAVPEVIDQPVEVPVVHIHKDEDAKLRQLITLSNQSTTDKHVFFIRPTPNANSRFLFAMLRSYLKNLGVKRPMAYVSELTKALIAHADNPDVMINMFPWNTLDEDTAIKLHLELNQNGYQSMPITYPPGDLVINYYLTQDRADHYEAALDGLLRISTAQMVITNKIQIISKGDSKLQPIALAVSQFHTREELLSPANIGALAPHIPGIQLLLSENPVYTVGNGLAVAH